MLTVRHSSEPKVNSISDEPTSDTEENQRVVTATSSEPGVAGASGSAGRHMMDGTVRVFLAEALVMPAGLITAAVLTRRLGPVDYGLFTLAINLIVWLQWTINALYARATFKLISEATDWRPVGATVLRLHLWTGGVAALLLLALAQPLAAAMGEPALAGYLRWFALDVPLFSLALAHRNILIGVGDYRQRALASAGRWTARVVLIVGLVCLGYGVLGAIWGSIGASLVELAIGRFYVRPSLVGSSFPARKFFNYAVPLLVSGLCMQLYDKIDLFLLMPLGASAEQVGFYGAARNLALAPAIFPLALAPLLLSTLSRLLRDGKTDEARRLSAQALRTTLGLLPLSGLVVGCAKEIVSLFFGRPFLPAGPMLAWLFAGASLLAVMTIGTTILTAIGKLGWTVALSVPFLLVATLGYVLAIPRQGAMGGALVTFEVALLGALTAIAVVQRLWPLELPLASLGRSLLVAGGAYFVSAFVPVSGYWVLVKLPLVGALALVGLGVLGEFKPDEIAFARKLGARQK